MVCALLFATGCGDSTAEPTPEGGPADATIRPDGSGSDASMDAVVDAVADGTVPDATPDREPLPGDCTDGTQNGDETDVDCGGSCDPCTNGSMCAGGGDCQSERCEDGSCSSPPGTHPDIVRVESVAGRNPGGRGWADSYSVGDKCYCESSFDHNIGPIMVDTPVGRRTVREVCDAIGPGPGSRPDRPLYNDIQCGNGPPNDAGDEEDCPGRVDIGRDGCGHIGPRWDLSVVR